MGFDPLTMALAQAGVQAAGSVGSGILANQANKETKLDKKKRNVIDQLMASLSGDGPYAGIFGFDEAAFDKSFVQPALSRFRNQVAPQIQQSYIASGQQRGTPIEDQLLRAGVEMDQMLNQNYLQFQNAAKDRAAGQFSNILGTTTAAKPDQSTGQAAAQGGAGFLASDAFGDSIKNIASQFSKQPQRAGFTPGSITT